LHRVVVDVARRDDDVLERRDADPLFEDMDE